MLVVYVSAYRLNDNIPSSLIIEIMTIDDDDTITTIGLNREWLRELGPRSAR